LRRYICNCLYIIVFVKDILEERVWLVAKMTKVER